MNFLFLIYRHFSIRDHSQRERDYREKERDRDERFSSRQGEAIIFQDHPFHSENNDIYLAFE